MSGTRLQFTTAYHPQTDGQSEVTNRGLEQYLRAFTFEQPSCWFTLLSWAELALNCSLNSSIGISPFQALYGREPPSIFDTPASPAKNVVTVELLSERSALLSVLKKNIARAQMQMTRSANVHRRALEFELGDRVWLHLQPYRQHSVGKPISAKLGCCLYGPFDVVERIGKVAYRLRLPVDSRIHDVFHVSLLKKYTPPLDATFGAAWPSSFHRNSPLDVPVAARAFRTVLVHGVPQTQWCNFWSSSPTSNPSWEPADEIRRNFPNLCLEDNAIPMGRGLIRTPTDIRPCTTIPKPCTTTPGLTMACTVRMKKKRTRMRKK